MKIEIIIPGPPRGKGRPKFTKTGHAYTPEKTAAYENLVRLAYQQAMGDMEPFTGPVKLTVKAYMPIPASVSKKRGVEMRGQPHPKKPDTTNVVKAIEDGLNGVAYKDDAQIWSLTAIKTYGVSPRLVVEIEGEMK